MYGRVVLAVRSVSSSPASGSRIRSNRSPSVRVGGTRSIKLRVRRTGSLDSTVSVASEQSVAAVSPGVIRIYREADLFLIAGLVGGVFPSACS